MVVAAIDAADVDRAPASLAVDEEVALSDLVREAVELAGALRDGAAFHVGVDLADLGLERVGRGLQLAEVTDVVPAHGRKAAPDEVNVLVTVEPPDRRVLVHRSPRWTTRGSLRPRCEVRVVGLGGGQRHRVAHPIESGRIPRPSCSP